MNEDHKITLTYLNIRQSIAVLLAKLILADVLLAITVIGLYFFLVQGDTFLHTSFSQSIVFLYLFLILGVTKILLSTFIVLLWLNEYYEITSESVIHKQGIIFRKTEQYALDKIRVMEIKDSFIGELFNFATITLYDIRLQKYLDMYLIHNPQRYTHILQALRPHIEIKKDRVRLPFMPKRANGELETDKNYD